MNTQIDYVMGTAVFAIDKEASTTKESFKGIFKVKCILSPLEYIQSDAMYRELLGKTNPQYASNYVSELCYAYSQLKYRVIDAPSWFKDGGAIPGSTTPDNVLIDILDKAVAAEKEFRKTIEEKYDKARGEVKEAIDNGTLSKEPKEQGEETEEDFDKEFEE
jgi:hypothetical protein